MTSLAARVAAIIRRRRLARQGLRVAAAVSGGADSVALLHLLAEIAATGRLTLAGIAHLNHGLRGADAERDAAFCRTLAGEMGLAFDTETVDVAGDAAARRVSREQAARDARYAYLERARVRLGADAVAVAHTRDDQAETVLMRLFRGAGTRGLAGIPARRGTIIRPLIDIPRADLRDYLRTGGRAWVEDATNEDVGIPRNWIRHRLLPQVVDRFGPGVIEAMARSADLATVDDEWLTEAAVSMAGPMIVPAGDGLAVDVALLQAAPLAFQRRVIVSALGRVTLRQVTAAEVDAALAFVSAGRPVSTQLGGRVLELSPSQGVLVIRAPGNAAPTVASAWQRELGVPGVVDLPEAGGRMRAETALLDDLGGYDAAIRGDGNRVVAAGAGSALTVRSWQPGDALQVLGLSGRKKVQDLFVDRKVPRHRRHQVPLVVCGDGRIVWVTGCALGEAFRVTPATKSVVVLKFEPLGGPD